MLGLQLLQKLLFLAEVFEDRVSFVHGCEIHLPQLHLGRHRFNLLLHRNHFRVRQREEPLRLRLLLLTALLFLSIFVILVGDGALPVLQVRKFCDLIIRHLELVFELLQVDGVVDAVAFELHRQLLVQLEFVLEPLFWRLHFDYAFAELEVFPVLRNNGLLFELGLLRDFVHVVDPLVVLTLEKLVVLQIVLVDLCLFEVIQVFLFAQNLLLRHAH